MPPLTGLRPQRLPFHAYPATVADPVTATTCRYELAEQPGYLRGPARYLRPAVEPAEPPGPDSDLHDHAHTPPASGTPCLVFVFAGDYDDAWVIPFQ